MSDNALNSQAKIIGTSGAAVLETVNINDWKAILVRSYWLFIELKGEVKCQTT